ncbi:MAG: insulinase family protein, partial [Pedobacter sp.]
ISNPFETQGTKNKTPEQLEEAIKQLGASINFSAGTEDIRIRATTLARNYGPTLSLVKEMLLEPRWDEKEFALLKQATISQIRQQEANPNSVAQNAYNELIYGKGNIRAKNLLGTLESVNSITMDDLKAFYEKNISPSVARLHVVGSLNKAAVTTPLASLSADWKAKSVSIPASVIPAAPQKAQIYFYDVPDAKQSLLRIGYPALSMTDKDYYPATVMNYILGGGGFASQLTQQLREGKGYTYGINSNFSGTKAAGPFTIGSGVRTNVTLESAQLIKEILDNYGKNYSAKDLETTKGFLVKSNARAFETAGSKLGMLESISKYGFKPDYIKQREEIVRNMTIDQIHTIG